MLPKKRMWLRCQRKAVPYKYSVNPFTPWSHCCWLFSCTHTSLSAAVPAIAAKTAKAYHLAFFSSSQSDHVQLISCLPTSRALLLIYVHEGCFRRQGAFTLKTDMGHLQLWMLTNRIGFVQ